MLIAGGVGIGLVLGWAAARLIYRAPLRVRVWVLLGLVAQSLIVLELASALAAIGFGIALTASALACATWVRSLAARYGQVE